MQLELDYDAPHNGTETSVAAARSQKTSKVQADRERILAYVKSSGGATRDEIEAALGMQGNTVRPRVWELVRAGQLVETDERRETRSGCKANVLKVSGGVNSGKVG